ncbi:MAG: transporter substrate-binding protein [Ramlibacter sp.]|nr:transporter substrate-binding protein [Ramlibacter sp.]
MTSQHPPGIRRRSLIATLPLGLASFAAPSFGQAAFPTKPIKFIAAFPPGSGTDVSARYYADKLGQLAKQSVVVENQPGGNGFIAIGNVLRAPPDGYTVLIGGASHFTTNVVLFKQLPYDPVNDLIPLGLLIAGAFVLAVPATSPFRTLKDFVDKAKAAPGALNSGTGAPSYLLSLAAFYKMAGIRLNSVPYKGSADVSAALAGAFVDVGLVDPLSSIPLAKAGKLRILAAGGEQRMPEIPDVPTFIESGYPGFTALSWAAAALPAKTPQSIVNQYREWLGQITATDETRAFFRRVSAEPGSGGAEGMRRQIATEIERWRSVAADAGIKPE